MSWVHEQDLIELFSYCISNNVPSGVYNATSTTPVTNQEFSKTLAQVLHRPFFLPKTPEFILKLIFGEMSQLVLVSQRLSNSKITSTGFQFKFNTIQEALTNVYGKAEN
jgi:NAD dependent epimerase/dehydratase family enzyme